MAEEKRKGLGGIPRTQPKWSEQAHSYLNQAGSSLSSMTRETGPGEQKKTFGGAVGAGVGGAIAGKAAGTALIGAFSGAAKGSAGGPPGMAIGAIVGLATYFLS